MFPFFKKALKTTLASVLPRRVIVWKGRLNRNQIALTFDDGPHPFYTAKILDLLQAYNAQATFFVIGDHVTKYPDLARRIVGEGHEIGNHSLTHNGYQKTPLRNVKEIQQTQKVIYDITGVRPCFFRPPYGILSMGILGACLANRLTLALWSLDAEDAEDSLEAIRARTSSIGNGEIVLMHDDNERTLNVVSELIQKQAEERRFVTLRILLEEETPSSKMRSF